MVKRQVVYKGVFLICFLMSGALAAEAKTEERGEEYRIGHENVLQNEEYRIGRGNVLQIDVFYGRGELSRRVKVSPRGLIVFPLLGEVKVEGLTVSEVKEKLTYLLEKDFFVDPQVSVFVEEYSRVFILGEVEKPGSYSLKGNLTVIELISLAGGFTGIAAPNRVKIIRTLPDGSKEEIRVRVHDIIRRGGVHILLKAGDMVIVPESFW